jgi:Coenzyme A transferase
VTRWIKAYCRRMGVEVLPAIGRWDDFASFMVPRKPGSGGCVCMSYRDSSLGMPGRIAHMRGLCESEPGPGVLAYVNWMVPGRMAKGMGGAMDLVHGARRVIVVMEHTTKDGSPRLVRECTFPLTGKAVAHRVITDLAVLDVEAGTFRVVELAPGVDRATIEQRTDAPLRW